MIVRWGLEELPGVLDDVGVELRDDACVPVGAIRRAVGRDAQADEVLDGQSGTPDVVVRDGVDAPADLAGLALILFGPRWSRRDPRP